MRITKGTRWKVRRVAGNAEVGTCDKAECGDGLGAGPRNNVWSSTFDPGRNANMKKMGSSYYDKPVDDRTTWDQHLASQESQADTAMVENNVAGFTTGKMNSDDIKKMMSPAKVDAALKKLDPDGSGKVEFAEVGVVANDACACGLQPFHASRV